ncbi:hypothetical protein Gotri_023058, partial [Gossypium trilobum]|nr:hypothetical protein [Gossypium trilobum]
EDEDTTFTSEWNDCRRNITDALRCYKKLWKDKRPRDKVANILKVSGKWVNTIKQIGCFSGLKAKPWRLALSTPADMTGYNSDNNANASRYKFVYEGLYRVTRFDKEIESGFSVYKFQLDMLEDHQQYDSKWKQKRI